MPAVKQDQTSIFEVTSPDLQMIGFEQVTSLASAAALTPPANIAPVEAMIQAEAQDVRWRCDGVSPTASVGMLLPAGQTMYLRGPAAIKAFKAIQVAASAKLNVSYWA